MSYFSDWRVTRAAKKVSIADMPTDEEMEDFYGKAARYSEHKRGEHITYMHEGDTFKGEILWVSAPGKSASGDDLPLRYVVLSDRGGFIYFVLPGDVVKK